MSQEQLIFATTLHKPYSTWHLNTYEVAGRRAYERIGKEEDQGAGGQFWADLGTYGT